MERIPFKSNLTGTCGVCGTPAGALHQPGCLAEACPICGALVVCCTCGSLPPADFAQAVKNLYNSLSNLTGAWKNAACFPHGSVIGIAAWFAIALNAPGEIQVARYHRAPGIPEALAASYYAENDTPVFTTLDVAQIGRAHV